MSVKANNVKDIPIENQRVRAIRGSMTREVFADRLGISVDNINKIEGGRTPVTIKTAQIIHDKCGVSLDYIYGYSEDTNDDASLMLLYLKKMFGLSVDENNVAKITVKDSVLTFLEKYERATKLYESGEIPVEAYTPWVEKLKADFNESFEADSKTVVLQVMSPDKYNEMDSELKNLRLDKQPTLSVGSVPTFFDGGANNGVHKAKD